MSQTTTVLLLTHKLFMDTNYRKHWKVTKLKHFVYINSAVRSKILYEGKFTALAIEPER